MLSLHDAANNIRTQKLQYFKNTCIFLRQILLTYLSDYCPQVQSVMLYSFNIRRNDRQQILQLNEQ